MTAPEAPARPSTVCRICQTDVSDQAHIVWQDNVWCWDCVTIVRVGGRLTVQARF